MYQPKNETKLYDGINSTLSNDFRTSVIIVHT